jgi:Fe-S-cluster containining protein
MAGNSLLPTVALPPSCEGCGACCINKEDPKWVQITPADVTNMKPRVREYLQPGDEEDFALMQDEKGACLFLNNCNNCEIYVDRPIICRQVLRGTVICLASLERKFINERKTLEHSV